MDLKSYVKELNRRAIQPFYRPVPADVKPKFKKFYGIKTVLCDIYGTIIVGKSNSVADLETNKQHAEAFHNTLKEFNFQDSLRRIKAKRNSAELLKELYLEEIKKTHTSKRKRGISNPEVKIEKIWHIITKKLIAKGYKYNKTLYGNLSQLSLKVAYFHQYVNENSKFYKNAFNVLKNLKNRELALGLVSNAQFYTPINLEIELKKLSKGKLGLYEMFDKDLISFSYKVGRSKPGKEIFKKVLNNLRRKEINKNQVIFIGNDMIKDIKLANDIGFKTVLFARDKNTLKLNAKIKPDAIITDWTQLLKIIK